MDGPLNALNRQKKEDGFGGYYEIHGLRRVRLREDGVGRVWPKLARHIGAGGVNRCEKRRPGCATVVLRCGAGGVNRRVKRRPG
jgi:hypothetical protein